MTLALLLLLFVVAHATTSKPTRQPTFHPAKPNFIVFMTDDLGYGEVNTNPLASKHNASYTFPTNAFANGAAKAFYRPEGPAIMRTPHLARMASQGIRALMSYAPSAICSPSRAAIFLERHVGVVDCIRGNKVAETQEMLPMRNALNFVQELKLAGYATGYFGKWGQGTIYGGPWLHGFDTYAGQLFHIEAHTYFPDTYYSFKPGQPVPNRTRDLDMLKVNIKANQGTVWTDKNCALDPNSACVHINDLVMDHAMDFITANSQQPFFTFIAPTYPHAGKYNTGGKEYREAPAKRISPDRINQTPATMRGHASQLEEHMDKDVGRILDFLEANPTLDRNTLFIFTSDNGANEESPFDKTIYSPTNGLRGAKRDLYDGGLRVPTILRWPGTFPAGGVSIVPHALYDIGPTFRDIVGLPKAPTHTSAGHPTLSTSMYDVWRTGRYDSVRHREFLQFEMCDEPGNNVQCQNAIIDLRNWEKQGKLFKLIQFPGKTGKRQLFNIRQNPREGYVLRGHNAKRNELHKIKTANRSAFKDVCVVAPA